MSHNAEQERKRRFVAEQRVLDQQRREALKILRDIKHSPQPTAALVESLKQSDSAVLCTEVTSPPRANDFSGTRYMETRGHLAFSRGLFSSSSTPQKHHPPHFFSDV